jgi:hypothetical protein
MYWIQWHMARMRADATLDAEASSQFRFAIPAEIRCELDEKDGEEAGEYGVDSTTALKAYRWQDFSKQSLRKRNRISKAKSNNKQGRTEAPPMVRRSSSREMLRRKIGMKERSESMQQLRTIFSKLFGGQKVKPASDKQGMDSV